MTVNASAPWHRESFDRFLEDRLPKLLAERLPLSEYRVESLSEHTCAVTATLSSQSRRVEMHCAAVPQPDEQGLFIVDGRECVVVPVASSEDLERAEIRCVGEQLLSHIEERLPETLPDLTWGEEMANVWLPVDKWVREFLRTAPTAQDLDDRNWLAARTHLRRLSVPSREGSLAASHFGRVCPFETPEGPNIGRTVSLALGGTIRDGKLVVLDASPEAALGLSASMVPFLEHNDANRQLMGVNMMRQWLSPPDPEPALVRTGNEPDEPSYWCGRNLLTAYVSWGPETFEDAILISESCAKRLSYPQPVEVGDKLSNRHGTKGTVSRIAPDEEMPHLPDGTPVELVFAFLGCHARLNFGQIREAVMSRIARAEGQPANVPPFHAPSEDELRQRLVRAGLPESGMEVLALGRGGLRLQQPSTVGYVYWGRLHHVAHEKLHASVNGVRAQRSSGLEYQTLRDLGAFQNLAEQFNTRSADREEAEALADRVAMQAVEQTGAPTPAFAALVRRLRAAGINAKLEDERLTFEFATPEGPRLNLARPVPHPWLRERELAEVGAFPELPEYHTLVGANANAAQVLDSSAPPSLASRAVENLTDALQSFFDVLLTPDQLRLGGRVLFSARAVLSPAFDLRPDQVGLAEEIAWTLFGPLVVREFGSDEEVRDRTPRATQVLDRLMAQSWVLVNRAPTILPTSFLAFHPVRCHERVLRLHPLACMMQNADFDGDQAAVFLPITEAAQQEAGELLSVAGHLRRDPTLTKWVAPCQEMMWGLARLSLTSEGWREVEELAGTRINSPESLITRASLIEALRSVLDRDGVEAALEAAERLMRRGFEVTKGSGASISPFIGRSLRRPPEPATEEPGAWSAYAEEVAERIASRTDYADPDLGPQLLAVKSGARGSLRQLAWLAGSRGVVVDTSGAPAVVIRRSLVEGLAAAESLACVVGAREGLARVALECARTGFGLTEAEPPKGFNVLSRAMRARRPGFVFANAAATGETDPLTDTDSRLFVGLPVDAGG